MITKQSTREWTAVISKTIEEVPCPCKDQLNQNACIKLVQVAIETLPVLDTLPYLSIPPLVEAYLSAHSNSCSQAGRENPRLIKQSPLH